MINVRSRFARSQEIFDTQEGKCKTAANQVEGEIFPIWTAVPLAPDHIVNQKLFRDSKQHKQEECIAWTQPQGEAQYNGYTSKEVGTLRQKSYRLYPVPETHLSGPKSLVVRPFQFAPNLAGSLSRWATTTSGNNSRWRLSHWSAKLTSVRAASFPLVTGYCLW